MSRFQFLRDGTIATIPTAICRGLAVGARVGFQVVFNRADKEIIGVQGLEPLLQISVEFECSVISPVRQRRAVG